MDEKELGFTGCGKSLMSGPKPWKKGIENHEQGFKRRSEGKYERLSFRLEPQN